MEEAIAIAQDSLTIAEDTYVAIVAIGKGRGYPANDETVKHLKKAAIEMLSRQVMNKAKLAEALGIGRRTLYRMEKEDPAFAQEMLEAQESQDHMRNDAVENTWLQRLLKGEAAELGYIFYLCNRMPDRWKDKRALIGNMNVNTAPMLESDHEERKMVSAWSPEQRKLFIEAMKPIAGKLFPRKQPQAEEADVLEKESMEERAAIASDNLQVAEQAAALITATGQI